MRSLLKLFVFVSAIVLIAISCQKVLSNENSSSAVSNNEFNTAYVKNWYVQTFVKTADWQNVWAKEKNVVDWKNDSYHKVGTMEVIEYPLQKQKTSLLIIHQSLTNDQIKKMVNASLKRVAFIKNTKNEITVRELDYIPDWEYLQKKQFDIGNTYYGKPGSDFTGNLVVKSWNGTVLSMFKIDNGAIAKKYSLNSQRSTAQSLCPGEEACMWYEDCDFYGDGFYTNCGEPYVDPTDCIDTGSGCDPMGGGDPCQIYGCNEGGGGSGTEDEITCETLSAALQNAQFIESPNAASQSSILTETTTEIQRSDFFSVGKYEIPLWASWEFFANNKIIIEKNGSTKKFKDYIFGETTIVGTSLWYSCTANTLSSSSKNISGDKKTIDGYHWFHFKTSLLFQGCPVTTDSDRGTSFMRKIGDY
jgi:hypothetical protein